MVDQYYGSVVNSMPHKCEFLHGFNSVSRNVQKCKILSLKCRGWRVYSAGYPAHGQPRFKHQHPVWSPNPRQAYSMRTELTALLSGQPSTPTKTI